MSPRPTWRFGVGARTGEARTDDHHVDNLWLVVGAEVASTSALVEVSSNGQQFTSSRVPFIFNAPHAISSVSPERGPVAGAPGVVIRGAGFSSGSDYKCRFGRSTVVNASYFVRIVEYKEVQQLECTVPPGLPPGGFQVGLALTRGQLPV